MAAETITTQIDLINKEIGELLGLEQNETVAARRKALYEEKKHWQMLKHSLYGVTDDNSNNSK